MFGFFRKKNEFDDYYVDERDGRRISRSALYPKLFWHFLVLLIIAIIIVGAIGLTSGRTMMTKLLLSLATPVGMVWIGLFLAAYSLTICRIGMGAIVSWMAWLVLTLAGNSYISSAFIQTLEQPYLELKPLEEEPFDVIVVLGGSTTTSPNGEAQLGRSGDRIMLAARMIAANKTPQIICTGTEWQPKVGNDLDISEESNQILSEFAGAEVELIRLKGTNTKEEMESLATWLEDNPKNRIGLITSAWHLPRATRLAESNGIEVVPLPSDFETTRFRPHPNLLVPSAGHLEKTRHAIHEYLGRIVGQ